VTPPPGGTIGLVRSRPLAFFPILMLVLAACAPPPKPAEKAQADPTKEPSYGETVAQLASLDRDAESLLAAGKHDEAAAVITKAQPLEGRLLAPSHPTLAAMEAAGDLDQLYGRMLMQDGRYGWARLEFQKNATRWKIWQPQTPDTARRLKEAQAAMAECDRHLQ